MRNITVAVSGDSFRQTRVRAAKDGISVSAAMPDLLPSPGSRKNLSVPFTRPRADAEIKTRYTFRTLIL
jgi:hypothetical protein